MSSVSPSSGKQYVPAEVRSGRTCSSLSEVSVEGRESRKTRWSPALTHRSELLLILIFSDGTSISRPHCVSEAFCLYSLKLHPRRTAGAGGSPGIPQRGGHGSALRFCLKTHAGEQKGSGRHREEPSYMVCEMVVAREGFSCSIFSAFIVQTSV